MNDAAWQDHESPLRWLVCLALVLLVHVGAGLYLVSRTALQPMPTVEPAVMIDLAPLPKAPELAPEPDPVPEPPAPVPLEVPPPEPPPQVMLEPPPPPVDMPAPEPPPELILEPPPVPVTPAVPLPPKPPPPKRPPPPRPGPPQPAPAQAEPPPPAAAPAAAVRAAPSAAAAANWQSLLLAHLKRAMRYPASAQMRREQGVALVWFRMTPSGQVLAFRLERSSGHASLDEESMELIRRAQPLPALPADWPQEPIERVVPLRYELR